MNNKYVEFVNRKIEKKISKLFAWLAERRKRKIIAKYTLAKNIQYEASLLKIILKEYFGLNNFSYLDIGCNDPILGSITHNFYKESIYGVCIDANPIYIQRFKDKRPKDTFVHIGITDSEEGELKNFYVMNNKLSSTFDEQWAKENAAREDLDIEIEKVIQVNTRNINSIMDKYFIDTPDMLLLDLEGLDFRVIKTLDFDKYRPKLIMMETYLPPLGIYHPATYVRKVAKHMRSENYLYLFSEKENSFFIDKNQL